ncbi:endonuclease/exonuclease/phosphatase family protein [Methylosarcina fibrata]|uniref:endonuclease/exonuclease/phosphatase family protein n=1 Tax=Methylosarcina fibrata TaxID=105972 RepID=UPI0003A12D24|nr:endonuclease/exonuclease/phosphatase family protein [Methylosarcina fibrata]
MKTLFRGFVCVVLISGALSASAGNKINVMTLNQYLGADLTPILSAPDSETFNTNLVGVLAQVAETDFRLRVFAQAEAIARRSPDILALQEVWQLSCTDFDFNPATGCEDPLIANAFVDHLELTLKALNHQGARFKTAALVKNLDLEKINIAGVPGIAFNINGVDAFLVAVDRDAILVRDGIPARSADLSGCAKPSVDGCNYQVVAEAETPLGPLAIERGYIAVDATVAGRNYRIFNTHLEVKGEDVGDPLFTYYQASQAYELIQSISLNAPLNRSVLLLGDINSSPDQSDDLTNGIITPYHQLSAEYIDVWDLKPGNPPGYTCCQVEDLKNRRSNLYERIDMIFSADEPEAARNVRLIGNKPFDKTVPKGLWFSDHAAVAADLLF